jgi:hypothetical protein
MVLLPPLVEGEHPDVGFTGGATEVKPPTIRGNLGADDGVRD